MSNKYNIKFYNNIKKILNVPIKLLFNVEVTGIENIPSKPYILAGNHKSLFDIPLKKSAALILFLPSTGSSVIITSPFSVLIPIPSS